MRRPRRIFSKLLLLILVAVAVGGGFWMGLIPQRLSPLSPISLENPKAWFMDQRLATLRRDPQLCQSVLKLPHIDASAVPDSPIKNGCGWINAVKFSTAGGARLGASTVTCEMAAALALWVEHEVQPAALEHFGKRVADISDMGTYGCRNIIGNPLWKDMRSQHATANAIDISAFTLEDGRKISVLKDWKADGPAAKFLREIHARACRYFRVSLSPNFNAAHANHFHFDRGLFWSCR